MTVPGEKTMVVALVDITGFAKACMSKSDVETFAMLNKFYAFVADGIGEADGAVIKVMGDSALVTFPEDKAKQAVACLQKLAVATDGIWSEFNENCMIRIKARVGSVALGPMGPDGRLDVVGNTVNQLFLMPWTGPALSEELKALVEK